MSIRSLDYIFSVKQSEHTDSDLETLLAALLTKGFQTQARPGTDAFVLVFAKLSASAYTKAVQDDLMKCYEFGVSAKEDNASDRSRIIYNYLTSPESAGGAGITPGKGKWGFVEALMPNSAYLANDAAVAKARLLVLSASVSTAWTAKAYGTDVALYFEFVKYYIVALAGLSLFGIVAFLKAKNYSLTYSFVNLFWGVGFLLFWKRREAQLVNLWGVQNSHKITKYDADLADLNRANSVPHSKEKDEGFRFIKQLAFVPVALVFVVILVSYQLACFVLEIFLAEIYDGPGKMFLTLLPTVLISVFVPIFTIVYNMVVDKFLTWESHDNNYTRYDSFVVKSFTLNFLTGYMPLLITAFIYLPFAHLIQPNLPNIQSSIASRINSDRYVYKYLTKLKSQQEFTINQERLNGQFFFFIVTNQIVQLVMKYALPLILPIVINFVQTTILGKKEKAIPDDKPEEHEWLTQVRKTIQLLEHNVHDEYRGMALQFGYLIMFGPVWTLAPLLSVFFNALTFKLDTLKLTNGKYFRPPVPSRNDSIHPWDCAFFALAWLGSIISPIVTLFYRHGTKPPKPMGQFAMDKASVNMLSVTFLMLTLVVSEHLFVFLYLVGTKISSFLKTDKEVENNFVENDIKLRRSAYSSKVEGFTVATSSEDWKKTSAAELKKQVAATHEATDEKVDSAKLTGVSVAGGLTAVNRKSKLEELEEKKRQLEKQRKELKNRSLESQMESGDSIIDTVDSHGKPTQAIIDGDLHISMDDVKDVEKKLDENDAKKAETAESEEGKESKVSSESESLLKKKGLKKLLKRK